MTIRELFVGLGFEIDEQSQKKAEDTIKNMKSMGTRLLGAVGIAFSLTEINALAEEFNGINDQIRNATRGMGEQAEIQKKIMAAAQDTRVSYQDTAKFVGALVQENKELFGTVDEAVQYASVTTKLFKAAGKSQEEIAALQEAINKSFAKGIVDSETINQLYERAPEAVNILAGSLGVAKEQLAKMATEGAMTVADLKNAFIDSADKIQGQFDELDFNISDALLNIRNRWGFFLDELNSSTGITKSIAKGMVKGFSALLDALKKGIGLIQKLADKAGGAGNLFKLLAAAAGGIFIALKAQKILGFLKTALGFVKGIGRHMTLANLKIAAIAAVVAALFLIIDDFIGFMQGKDSLIGSVFEKMGINADQARESIQKAWSSVMRFLSKTWDTIKKAAKVIFGGLGRFWDQNGKDIKNALLSVWLAISTALKAVWDALAKAGKSVFGALQAFWERWGDKIKAFFEAVWKRVGDSAMTFLDVVRELANFIKAIFSGDWEGAWQSIQNIGRRVWEDMASGVRDMWNAFTSLFSGGSKGVEGRQSEMSGRLRAIWDGLKSIAETIFGALQAFWDRWGGQIANQFTIFWNFLSSLIDPFLQVIQGVIDFIAGVFTGDWERAWNGVKEIFTGVWNAVLVFFRMIWDTIYNWFGDSIDKIVAKVKAFVDKVKALVGGVVDFFKGIGGAVGGAFDKVKGFFTGGDMDVVVKAATANAAAGGGDRTNNVHQDVKIENNFYGDDRAAQVNGAKAMGKSADDATAQMARGLAVGR